MLTESFFVEQTEESKLKANIVSRYFSVWVNVMASQKNQMIRYLDLFSGPGRYEDGNPSTPLLILDKAINHWNSKVPKKIDLIFNDSDPDFFRKLEDEIRNFPGVDKLRFIPSIKNLEIGEETVKEFQTGTQIPTLSFIDPWGYKGLSLPLVRSLVKDWGCDCIFFFNYRRINPGIENPLLQDPISILFTREILDELRGQISGKKPHEREKIILRKMKEVFHEWGMKYVLPFPFKNENGKRTTHYLIFISKHIQGYTIMADIMGSCSSCRLQGVPSFEFNPAGSRQPKLLEIETPLDDLKKMLLVDFSGMTVTMGEIFEQHQIESPPYLKKNYKKALLDLEKAKMIETDRKKRKARAGQFPDDMLASFRSRK